MQPLSSEPIQGRPLSVSYVLLLINEICKYVFHIEIKIYCLKNTSFIGTSTVINLVRLPHEVPALTKDLVES